MPKDTLFYKILQTVALIFLGHLVMMTGIIFGLGIFLTLPAFMTVFDLYNQIKDRTDFARLKLLSFVLKRFKKYGRTYALISACWSLCLILIMVNCSYLLTHWGLIGYGMVFISLIIFYGILSFGILFAYLVVHYPDKSLSEIYRNALAYSIARAVELWIGNILILALILAFENISLGLMICTFLGIISYSYFKLCGLLLSGLSINRLIRDWRRSE